VISAYVKTITDGLSVISRAQDNEEETEEQEKEKEDGGAGCVETDGIPIVSFLPAPPASRSIQHK
jgi:hypothetical protein